MNFFELLSIAFSCVIYGVIVTISIMAILYFTLRLINEGIVKSIVFYITGFFLFILLSIQTSLMIGAIRVNSSVKAIEITINQMVEKSYGTIGINDSQNILDNIIKDYPLLGVYVGTCDFSGNDSTTIASSMSKTIHSFLIKYIWHRISWSLGIIVIASLIALMFDKGRKRNNLNHDIYASSYSVNDMDNF